MPTGRTNQVDVEQLLGDGAEDIVIGAYARRVRRQRILTGLAGVGLLLLAFAAYWVTRPAAGVHPDDGYPVQLRCIDCGGESRRTIAFDQTFPLPCPHCGKTAAAPLWECRACGERFAELKTEGVRCPSCGSSRCGSAVASRKSPD